MLRFFHQIPPEPQIKLIIGLTQIFTLMSCRATPRHLESTVEDSGEIDFSPSTSTWIEMTKLRSAASLNHKNPWFKTYA